MYLRKGAKYQTLPVFVFAVSANWLHICIQLEDMSNTLMISVLF